MTCPLTAKQLLAALDGRVAAVDADHLGCCSACQRERRALEELLADLRVPATEDDADAFTARVMGRLDESREPAPSLSLRWPCVLLACAAALLLLWVSPSGQHARERTTGDVQAHVAPAPPADAPLSGPEQHTASHLDRLVEQLAAHGDYVNAERACAESLAIKAQALGAEHPAVAEQRATLQILVRLNTDA